MLKVGIIGLGEVSQLMHLPILNDLFEKYEVKAIADVSPSLVDFVKKKYKIEDTFLSPSELIEKSDTDVIFILAPDQYHPQYIIQALEKGKHVFVEKPVSLNEEELDKVVEVKNKYPNQVLMVGYMRRYAQQFTEAKKLMENTNYKTEYVRFRDIILEAPFYIGQTTKVFYPDGDISKEVLEEGSSLRKAQLEKALGDVNGDITKYTTYQMLTGLGCHSISAIRELVGKPKKVLSVNRSENGEQLVIVFDFGSFIGTYELVNNQNIVQFDAAIEVFQNTRKIYLKYETPYLRFQSGTLNVIESTEQDTKTTSYGPNYSDAFKIELLELYNCIKENREPKTTIEDYREDLLIFKEIMDKL